MVEALTSKEIPPDFAVLRQRSPTASLESVWKVCRSFVW